VNPSAAAVNVPDDHVWLRVADADWSNPLDTSYAKAHGGRWNAPGSYPVLYLNEDLRTARLQLQELFEGYPVNVEDLDGNAPYLLVLVGIPRRQKVADAISSEGLKALGLPSSYPADTRGRVIAKRRCQSVGAAAFAAALRGVWCRSAKTADGTGREFAWFPRGPAKARMQGNPLPFATWWYAASTASLLVPS